MLIFLFIVISYCTANAYTFFKLSALFHESAAIRGLIGSVIAILTFLPVFIPIYSHRGSEKSVTIISHAGYLWLAFLVPFFPAGVIIDLMNLIASVLSSGTTGPLISRPAALLIPAVLALCITVYGLYEAGNLCVERLRIETVKLPPGTDRIRIAQISDLHLGVLVKETLLDRVIAMITREAPDVIVSTGDLVDGITRHVAHLPEKLSKLHAPLGKYAVAGNHEMYGGIDKTAQFVRDSGFTLLRGEGDTMDAGINIAGVDFLGREAGVYRADAPDKQEHEMLSELPSHRFTLLLKHRSDVAKESLGLFDLQLSGHSHKGQIFPMSLATMFIFSYHTGFTQLPSGSAIYTSRGTGTAGPPVRFLSRPEITIIDIVRA